jgi:arabinose-5-phosphate isomerase
MHTELARWVLQTEAQAILRAAERIGPSFEALVAAILETPSKIIVTGIGKSAHIARKIAATLNSVGTPAVWLHAAEALHGDVGIVQAGDIALIFSKSGETPEVKALLPVLRERGARIAACVGDPQSTIARQADWVIDLSVEHEACPHNLTPTASTTVALAFGDALAVTLMKARDFGPHDFAATHPAGALGKRLTLRVRDLTEPHLPAVPADAPLQEVLIQITQGRKGAVAVLSSDAPFLRGIITDGDIRRALEKYSLPQLFTYKALAIATPTPKVVQANQKAYEALQLMEKYKVSQLIVLDGEEPYGMIHFHDIIREGIR